MGGGSFDAKAYRSYSSSVASKPIHEVFKSRTLDDSLDPKGVKVRESRDSDDNPQSTPMIAACDVSGSMNIIAEYFAKEGLGKLFEGILQRKPIVDPHLMFMAVGDVDYDHAPLQVSQFEADNRIVEQLTKMYVEGGGGSNKHETYDFPWYFAARHTSIDSLIKRGKKGYLYTIGDEETPEVLTRDHINKFLGYRPEADMPSKMSLEEAKRMYHVYHVVIEQGDYASGNPDGVRAAWKKMLGQHVIFLPDYKLLAETIISSMQMTEGVDKDKATSGWGTAAKKVLGDALHNLPTGNPAPKRLGA